MSNLSNINKSYQIIFRLGVPSLLQITFCVPSQLICQLLCIHLIVLQLLISLLQLNHGEV